MAPTPPILPRPADLRDLQPMASDGDFRREAERLADRVHRRRASEAASLA